MSRRETIMGHGECLLRSSQITWQPLGDWARLEVFRVANRLCVSKNQSGERGPGQQTIYMSMFGLAILVDLEKNLVDLQPKRIQT